MRLELTRFRGRLTHHSFGVEVVHESQQEGRSSRAIVLAQVAFALVQLVVVPVLSWLSLAVDGEWL